MKKLLLSQLHQTLGAKMMPFAGYEMPVMYAQGIVHEHLHCRSLAGFFDISHMGQFRLTGTDAAAELQKLVPSDLRGLQSGHQKYTVLTNSDGGIIDDIMIGRLPNGYQVVVNAACKETDFAYLAKRLSDRCRLMELHDRALFALQGPAAAKIMQKLADAAAQLRFMAISEIKLAGIDTIVSRSGYTGEDGFEISVAADNAEALARMLLAETEVEPIGLGARDTLRLEAGLCLYGHELNETITPVEAGLTWLIGKHHRDYPGADILARQMEQGVKLQRAGLIVDGKIPVREGVDLLNEEGLVVGSVTSGSYAPSVGKPVAMARVQSDFAKIGTALYATVRNHRVPLTVVRMPFHLHRYHR